MRNLPILKIIPIYKKSVQKSNVFYKKKKPKMFCQKCSAKNLCLHGKKRNHKIGKYVLP